MTGKLRRIAFAVLIVSISMCLAAFDSESDKTLKLVSENSLPEGDWMLEASFPDRKNYVDDTLAMNSMVSFKGYHGQGTLYVVPDEDITGFDLYINEKKADTGDVKGGEIYKLDFSDAAEDGTNTLQISAIEPFEATGEGARVKVMISYPHVLKGSLKEAGINEEALDLIDDIIQSDVDNGFASAQLAVVRNGRLVYENAWGRVNSYLPDTSPDTDSPEVTTDTLYDLASVSKMFGVNYAIQKLVSDGKLSIDQKVTEFLGNSFADDVDCSVYEDESDPEVMKTLDLKMQRKWKGSITIKDLLRHQAGFRSGQNYYNMYMDAATGEMGEEYYNDLFAGCSGSEDTKEATFGSLCRTPLRYEPGTKTVYSDLDYIILGLVVENVTGMNLDEYLKTTFCDPMGLTHITYRPLDNGFTKNDCAATEICGNTREGKVDFPGIRTARIQGEVHDETAYYSMAGISGHAGIFSNATDLAYLSSAMLTGGYDNNGFFSKNVVDMFRAPKSLDAANWGLGWYREGDDQRSWYFGTQADSSTIGHQGWTGTMVMVDPSRELVVVYLTNKINTPLIDKEKNISKFNGNCYTASTLGFVPQLLSIGMDKDDEDIHENLMSLLEEMVSDSIRLVGDGEANDEDLARVKNAVSKLEVYDKWAKDSHDDVYTEKADMLNDRWETYKERASHTPEGILNELSLEEKIEQMIMPDIRTFEKDGEQVGVTELNEELTRVLSEHDFGGVILFGENIKDARQTRLLTSQITNTAASGRNDVGCFISIDQEGGRVTRLKTGTQMPGNMALGAVGDPAVSEEAAGIIGGELNVLGINMDFSPVVDVNSNPANPIIGIRSFSDDPELVAKMGRGYIKGLHNEDIISSLKHFPGHGDTQTDSHTGLPLIDKSYDELKQNELIPFAQLTKDGADMVMTAHIQYPQIEKGTYRSIKDGKDIYLPATLSKTIISDILRKDLGFDGVVITDAMDMAAVAENIPAKESAKLAINADVDIILMPVDIHTKDGIEAMERYIGTIADMVKEGDIPLSQIDDSVLRILKLKEKYGLLNTVCEEIGEDDLSEAEKRVGSRQSHEVEWDIAGKAVTLLKNEDGILPLKGSDKTKVIGFYDSQMTAVQYAAGKLKDEGLIDEETDMITVSADGKDPSDYDDIIDDAVSDADNVIVISSLYGTDELDPLNEKGAQCRAIDRLIETMHEKGGHVIVISAQLPYDTARFKDADAILACYGARGMTAIPDEEWINTPQYGPNIPAAIYTIFGGSEPTGDLPVNIPGINDEYGFKKKILYKRGYGLEYGKEDEGK